MHSIYSQSISNNQVPPLQQQQPSKHCKSSVPSPNIQYTTPNPPAPKFHFGRAPLPPISVSNQHRRYQPPRLKPNHLPLTPALALHKPVLHATQIHTYTTGKYINIHTPPLQVLHLFNPRPPDLGSSNAIQSHRGAGRCSEVAFLIRGRVTLGYTVCLDGG